MEVRGQQPGGADEARARFRKVQAELAQANRDRVQQAREHLESLPLRRHQAAKERTRGDQALEADQSGEARNRSVDKILTGQAKNAQTAADGRDKIELSGGVLGSDAEQEAARAARVESLRASYQEGTLATKERVERAAVQLMGTGNSTEPAGDQGSEPNRTPRRDQ